MRQLVHSLSGSNNLVPLFKIAVRVKQNPSECTFWISRYFKTCNWCFSLQQVGVCFELQDQKSCKLGQMHVALSWVTSIQRLLLTGAFNKEASKANHDAAWGYDCLWNQILRILC